MPITSPLFEPVYFYDKKIIIKRDDLIDAPISGNKFFKLYGLLKQLQKGDIPQKIVSLGGYQSNYMQAVAALTYHYQIPFDYWTRKVPANIKCAPQGNLQSALKLGMNLCEHEGKITTDFLHTYYAKSHSGKDICILPQGGAASQAEAGMIVSATQIKHFLQKHNIAKASIFVASGTGATAFYLQKHLPCHQVVTTPCVGDKDYLIQQMHILGNDVLPMIIESEKKYRFGQCYREHLEMYEALLQQTGITFDLLYDPIAWQVLLANYDRLIKPVIYIHCGGVLGNQAMLARYRYHQMR
ncbi:1-aminocyclopropane-1-carboxylate deaminase [Facilibium subflavum]|uniref:1-aminocyclopropane-1-carboxylate deaminase n=1 Tax=Facilibium subflavum TaxID=2219058 RepID=UPI000E65CFBB|nr:1-aminocyclopropane-1-carboxylate deaminase [Facilibium subflavum]